METICRSSKRERRIGLVQIFGDATERIVYKGQCQIVLFLFSYYRLQTSRLSSIYADRFYEWQNPLTLNGMFGQDVWTMMGLRGISYGSLWSDKRLHKAKATNEMKMLETQSINVLGS